MNPLKSLSPGGEVAEPSHHQRYESIEGLRAFAVLAVVLFHVASIVPAGFVGVDIFFVISGFVVTSAATQRAGKVHLPIGSLIWDYFGRRTRRIIPAMAVCLLATFLVSVLIVPRAWLSDVNDKTGLAAFFAVSNFYLASAANDYWMPRAEFNPYTHTWSLAVEQQFYLVFPLLLVVWLKGRSRAAVALMCAVGAASLAGMAWWSGHGHSVEAFYLLPSRLWELGLGVLLAFTADRWRPWLARWPRLVVQGAGALGLALLLTAAGVVDSNRFPWPWALLPALSTALVIVLAVGRPDSWLAALLSTAPLVYIGKVSYSLYLWHWPVVVFARWTTGIDTPLAQLVCLALSFALAVASYRLVEVPFNNRLSLKTRRDAMRTVGLTLLGAGLAMGLSGGLLAARHSVSLSTVTRHPEVWSPEAPRVEADAPCGLLRQNAERGAVQQLIFEPQGCTRSGRTLFVAGDSHAGAYAELLRHRVQRFGDRVVLFYVPGCGALDLRRPTATFGAQCAGFVQTTLAQVAEQAHAQDLLFLPGLRIERLGDQWGAGKKGLQPPAPPLDRTGAEDEAVRLLAPIAQTGAAIVFEAPKPVFRIPLFRCADWFDRDNPACRAEHDVARADIDGMRAPVLASMSRVVGRVPRAYVWDPLPHLCDAQRCQPVVDGHPLFFDGDHLSAYGNQVLQAPFDAWLSQTMRAAGP